MKTLGLSKLSGAFFAGDGCATVVENEDKTIVAKQSDLRMVSSGIHRDFGEDCRNPMGEAKITASRGECQG